VVSILPAGPLARATAVIVPTSGAAEQLRRTIEELTLGPGSPALVLPDVITRGELYVRLHARLPDAPPLLTEFDREVLLRLSAEEAARQDAAAPFGLRPGLLAAILGFYDELRRRGRTIDSLDRHVRAPLEASRDTDRGAARLLAQTQFLSAAFAALERRVADSGRIDEHTLRALLLAGPPAAAYRRIIVLVGDQAGDPRGLWPADFDLLTRLPGLEQLDVVATERMLATGWLERLADTLPGFEEIRVPGETSTPVLLAPAAAPEVESRLHWVSRDREEELVDAARWIKHRARTAAPEAAPALDRTAIVFQRPLPYLYPAQQVFESAGVPYQALDALPLAAEPFAAALDLLLTLAADEPTRTALVEVLASPHWTFRDPAAPDRPLQRAEVAALDRLLRDAKYLGGWEQLERLATLAGQQQAAGGREAAGWRRAAPALAAAATVGPALAPLRTAASASAQLDALLAIVAQYESVPHPSTPGRDGYVRARAAVLAALAMLREAHARYDERPVPLGDLVATVRRWIEGQTFAPATGRSGVLLLDAPAAAFAHVDAVRLVGLVDTDWPERSTASIFYPAGLLREIGWAPDAERLSAARARFQDLLLLASGEVSVSAFTLEEDAIVLPSAFLEDVAAAGLPVARPPQPPAVRIFAHEALARPVAPDALGDAASRWLDLRQSRTPAPDARFRGSVGPRAPEAYAVSRVERFLECPFKYFAAQVLKLDEEREDESGLTPLERGQLLHEVFEAFFVAWRAQGHRGVTTANLSGAVQLFAEVAEAQLLRLPEGDRALERTYLLGSAASPGLADRAFNFEIEHGVEVLERLLEHPLEGTFVFEGASGPREVRVRGKTDRIDLLADGTLRIIDYKLGRAPKPARVLQLPVYGVAAVQQLDGRLGRQWSVGRAGYVAFKEKNAFVDLGGRAGNLPAALAEGQKRFVEAIERIEAGEFPVDPDEPWFCTRCGFSHVCRKDYVGDE
jgi:hypothetical protein